MHLKWPVPFPQNSAPLKGEWDTQIPYGSSVLHRWKVILNWALPSLAAAQPNNKTDVGKSTCSLIICSFLSVRDDWDLIPWPQHDTALRKQLRRSLALDSTTNLYILLTSVRLGALLKLGDRSLRSARSVVCLATKSALRPSSEFPRWDDKLWPGSLL